MQRLFYPFLLVFFVTRAQAQCNLPAPVALSFTEIKSCQFTINWSEVTAADHYKIRYKLSTDADYTVISNVGLVTSYTLTGLTAGLKYTVKISAVCSNNENGDYIKSSVKTNVCSTVSDGIVKQESQTSANVSWTSYCGSTSFKLKYKPSSSSQWTTISNINGVNYTLTGLSVGVLYDVQVITKCAGENSKPSPTVTFSLTPAMRNVLIIVLDDARQDPFAPDGGPAFFSNPNITRIAQEGVRFKYFFPASSECGPSRATILTGLYPHNHGFINNICLDSVTDITLGQILQSYDYYVGHIGKYHVSHFPQPGFDFWMENHSKGYFDQTWNINGWNGSIPGHKTNITADSAIGFFHKVPEGKSFFLQVGFMAPHLPYEPRVQDSALYLTESMPLGNNLSPYSENYPSVLYPCMDFDGGSLEDSMRSYYQMLAGVEENIGRILHELTTMGIIDSTLIIFTSDNGFMFGEHGLHKKRLAYEESIRIPLYMRYPPAITAGTVVDDELGSNIDLAPTILDYLGIPNTYSMDGISLKQMIEGNEHRNEFFYEFFAENCSPDILAIRSFEYKYVRYGCNHDTEEFFDLINDPEENENLINNSQYEVLIDSFRKRLLYWKNYYNYFSFSGNNNCWIENPVYIRQHETTLSSPYYFTLQIVPNPANSYLNLNTVLADDRTSVMIELKNSLGIKLNEINLVTDNRYFSHNLSTSDLPNGIYQLTVRANNQAVTKQFVVER